MSKEGYWKLDSEGESEEKSNGVGWKLLLALSPISIETCIIECIYLMKESKDEPCG